MQSPSRKPADLSTSLNRQLHAYAIGASAAGVSVLALAQPVEAKIVYTKAHVVLNARTNDQYAFDLNRDKVADFTFAHGYFYSTTTGFWGSVLQMMPYKSDGNAVLGNGNALPLKAGDKIGPSGRFSHYGLLASARGTGKSQNSQFMGEWANSLKGLRNRYVGLEFYIKGKIHYGWARVSVSKFRFVGTLTGYAYETVPYKPIIAGKTKGPDVLPVQPGSLGALAGGASQLQISAK
jgi:hypothetical protein